MFVATETFTGADAVGDLSADYHWSRLAGTPGADWGKVSNQAKISGNANSGSDYRMDVKADQSGLITLQATLVSLVGGGDATHFTQFGIYVSDGTTANNYAWYAVRQAGAGPLFDNFTLGKTVANVFTQLDQIFQTINANDVLKLTWDPATGDLKGYVSNVLISSKNDTALTGLLNANLNGYTNDPAFIAIVDNLQLSNALSFTTLSPTRRMMGVIHSQG